MPGLVRSVQIPSDMQENLSQEKGSSTDFIAGSQVGYSQLAIQLTLVFAKFGLLLGSPLLQLLGLVLLIPDLNLLDILFLGLLKGGYVHGRRIKVELHEMLLLLAGPKGRVVGSFSGDRDSKERIHYSFED